MYPLFPVGLDYIFTLIVLPISPFGYALLA
nr:MAG TPA: hypothetical protein [Crassvirales sp.]